MTASSSQGNPVLVACTGLIGSIVTITMIVVSIIAMVHNSNAHLRSICPDTKLWWVLLVDILVIGGVVGKRRFGDDAEDAIHAFVDLACMLGIAVWGLCEALSNCANDHLAHNNVRKMVLIWSGLVIAIPTLFVLTAAACGVSNLCCSDKEQIASPPRPVSATLRLEEDDEEDSEHTTVGRVPRTDFQTEV
jgi:predicted MFS family arabinose efflux permease